ncbi:MAG: DUF1178 family protein [Betaproteobacteria bacterium]|nr:DUF1178 family protein [Betaproteobacteria bacterium]
MIVFNLACSKQHAFDGWFRSGDDFQQQYSRGLVQCPTCGDTHVVKQQVEAPVDVNDAPADEPAWIAPDEQPVAASSMLPGLKEHMLKQFKQFVLANTESVGTAFAETVRRMHYGEIEPRFIRGQMSPSEVAQLREEGIEAVLLPADLVLDDGLQ